MEDNEIKEDNTAIQRKAVKQSTEKLRMFLRRSYYKLFNLLKFLNLLILLLFFALF